MLCPVCDTECNRRKHCPKCGFTEVGRTFLNQEEVLLWMSTTVRPFRENWLSAEGYRERYPDAEGHDIIRYHDYRRMNLFLDAVAEHCIKRMDKTAKSDLINNPNPIYYHRSLGLFIRNEYLYPQKYYMARDILWATEHGTDTATMQLDSCFTDDMFRNADNYSQQVIEIIIDKLSKTIPSPKLEIEYGNMTDDNEVDLW